MLIFFIIYVNLYLSSAIVDSNFISYERCMTVSNVNCKSLSIQVPVGINSSIVPDCTNIRGSQDCNDVRGRSGKYFVCVNGVVTTIYCDFDTPNGPWLVFQRRVDGSGNFYRKWNDYAEGFGDVFREFWLGLRTLNKLTKNRSYLLRIELTDFEDETRYAQYSNFNISSEASNFILNVGTYQGNAGDSLTPHNSNAFTTFDKDNDKYVENNCAVVYRGAWWYTACHQVNLNGLYLGGETREYATGIAWRNWKEYFYSLKATQMKIKRI